MIVRQQDEVYTSQQIVNKPINIVIKMHLPKRIFMMVIFLYQLSLMFLLFHHRLGNFLRWLHLHPIKLFLQLFEQNRVKSRILQILFVDWRRRPAQKLFMLFEDVLHSCIFTYLQCKTVCLVYFLDKPPNIFSSQVCSSSSKTLTINSNLSSYKTLTIEGCLLTVCLRKRQR